MKTRPPLRHGDLVKLHKKYFEHPLHGLGDTNLNDTFAVLRINGRSNKETYTKGPEGKKINTSSDGHCRLQVLNLRTKKVEHFDRKQVWKTGNNWKDRYFPSGTKMVMPF